MHHFLMHRNGGHYPDQPVFPSRSGADHLPDGQFFSPRSLCTGLPGSSDSYASPAPGLRSVGSSSTDPQDSLLPVFLLLFLNRKFDNRIHQDLL